MKTINEGAYGAAMQLNKLKVQVRRCCKACHSRIMDTKPMYIDGRAHYNCSSCKTMVKTTFREVEDWHQMHAVESQRYKTSKIPIEILKDDPECRSRPPMQQAWYEFAISEHHKHKPKYAYLRVVCMVNMMSLLPRPILEKARESLFKAFEGDHAKVERGLREIIFHCIDGLRPNTPNVTLSRRRLAMIVGVHKSAFCEKQRRYSDDSGNRGGYTYSPPLSLLVSEIVRIASDLEQGN